MKKLKSLWEEFKKFISRGNVMDLAVAVIIGAAFNAIVTSLTNNIIKPVINWAVGGSNGAGLVTMLKAVYTEDASGATIIDMTNSIYIDWGTFIMKIIDFLVIAVVLFVIIKVYAGLKDAAARKIKNTEKLIKKLRKGGLSEEDARRKAEEQIAAEAGVAEEEVQTPKPTTEELLAEIRDLLKDGKRGDSQ